MVTLLKNEAYGYGSRYSLKNCYSLCPTVWNLASMNLVEQKLHTKYLALIK